MKSAMPLAAIAFVFATLPVLAHHPFTAEFDWKQPTTLMGTITRIEWTNPHATLHVDVRDEAGTVTTWVMELGRPSELRRAGWSRTTLKVGDQVSVDGWRAKDGSRRLSAKSIIANNRELFAASSFFQKPAGPRPVATTGTR